MVVGASGHGFASKVARLVMDKAHDLLLYGEDTHFEYFSGASIRKIDLCRKWEYALAVSRWLNPPSLCVLAYSLIQPFQ
jgi:hypothetical protein